MTDQWEEEQINNHRDNNRNVHLAPDSLVLLVKQQAQGPARGRCACGAEVLIQQPSGRSILDTAEKVPPLTSGMCGPALSELLRMKTLEELSGQASPVPQSQQSS